MAEEAEARAEAAGKKQAAVAKSLEQAKVIMRVRMGSKLCSKGLFGVDSPCIQSPFDHIHPFG